MNWSLVLISIGIFNGLVLSILFLKNRVPHSYLGLFLLSHSIILIKYLGNAFDMYATYHVFIAMGEILEWVLAPLLFLYIVRFQSNDIRHTWIHFIPVLVYILILIPLHVYIAKNPDFEFLELHIQRSDFNYLAIPKIVQYLIYCIVLYPRVANQKWLSFILGIFLAETLALAVFYFQFLFTLSDLFSDIMVSSIMVLAVNLIAISGLTKSPIFQSTGAPEPGKISEPVMESSPAQGSALTHIFDKVRAYVEDSEIYKNQHLKLSDLSQVLSISEKQISQAVNECSGQNINYFINSYRIRTAERMLRDPAFNYLTIDAIAVECGFSNKVSFYKAFKKMHDISPKEFKELQNT